MVSSEHLLDVVALNTHKCARERFDPISCLFSQASAAFTLSIQLRAAVEQADVRRNEGVYTQYKT